MFGFGKTKHGKPALPTVRFDPKQITEAVRADLWARINEFEDLPCGQEKAIYQAALATVTKGFALDVLAQALIDMGVSKGRASEVTRYLANRASAIMNVERLVKLGSTKAKWGYSGAPCYATRTPSAVQLHMDAAHKAASGKLYPIPDGMLINGRRTHPGMDMGCKCVSLFHLPGFDD